MENDTFMALGLLPGESVVCKARIGSLSKLEFLPRAYSVITTRRFFIIRPFSGKSVISYDKIASIDLKRGAIASKLIIKMEKEANTGVASSTIVTFANAQNAIATFGILNNQILASRDRNYGAKESHRKALERRTQRKTTVSTAPLVQQTSVPNQRYTNIESGEKIDIDRIAASAVETAVLLKRFAEKSGRKGMEVLTEGAQRAWPVVNAAMNAAISTARDKVSDIQLMIARKQQTAPMLKQVIYTNDSDVSYLSSGNVYGLQSGSINTAGDSVFVIDGSNRNTQHTQTTVQVHRQRRAKSKMDPDRDLKIFRVRKMREGGGRHVPKEKPSRFNIFNE